MAVSMLRKSTEEDISDEEGETIINPFYDNYHDYVEEYVMPEVVAFYIASFFIIMLCGKQLSYNTIIQLLIYLIYVMKTMRKLRPK